MRQSVDTILQNIWYKIRLFVHRNDILSRLIQLNIIIYILINISGLLSYVSSLDNGFVADKGMFPLTYLLSLPADFSHLLGQWWGVFSYMFAHEAFLHLLMNMFILYAFGLLYQQFIGVHKLLGTYILGGIMGGMFYILAFNLLPTFSNQLQYSYAIGASAAVLAIVSATATYMPNYRLRLLLLGDIPLKYLIIIFVAIDLLSLKIENPGGHISHLGGMLYGFLYILLWRRGVDIQKPFGVLYSKAILVFKVLFYKVKDVSAEKERKTKTKKRDKDIIRIIEKVKYSGYTSLSEEEKKRLFE